MKQTLVSSSTKNNKTTVTYRRSETERATEQDILQRSLTEIVILPKEEFQQILGDGEFNANAKRWASNNRRSVCYLMRREEVEISFERWKFTRQQLKTLEKA